MQNLLENRMHYTNIKSLLQYSNHVIDYKCSPIFIDTAKELKTILNPHTMTTLLLWSHLDHSRKGNGQCISGSNVIVDRV